MQTVPRRSLSAIALAIPLLLLSPPGAEATDSHLPGPDPSDPFALPADLGERFDAVLSEFDSDDAPGVVAAVVQGGRIAFQGAWGMANLSHRIPLTPETRINIGSTAKQFTAFAVALLAEEGRLSLDDDVRIHLPEVPDLGTPVTLRHLLTHTSGYREFINALAIGGWRIEDSDFVGREEALRVVQRQPELQNAPGAEWNYNNTGYLLLGMVVERVTGEPFPAWMEANVFAPLGMDDTVIREDPRQVVPGAAYGYRPLPEGGFRHGQDVGAAVGAGSVYTTLADMARWMENLSTGRHGGRTVLEAMTTPTVLTSGRTTTYGLGIEMDREGGLRRIHHPGGDIAHYSHFAWFPELEAGIIVVSNHGGFSSTIPAHLTRAAFGEAMAPESADAPAETMASGEPDGAGPSGPDAASAGTAGAATGGAEGSGAGPPPSPDRLVGRYALEAQPGFILTVREEGERLVAHGPGQPPFPLDPAGGSRFAIPALGAELTFHLEDGEAPAPRLVLHQGGDHVAHRLDDAPLALQDFVASYRSAEVENTLHVEVDEGALVVRQRRRDPVRLHHVDGDTFGGAFPLLQVTFHRDGEGRVTHLEASNVRARGIRFRRLDP
ncbi:MAG: serine hydrolase [Gemmatimonadales bacterium]|nr:MAG: serine hydrolase [Gemmatimonadales bacterium]